MARKRRGQGKQYQEGRREFLKLLPAYLGVVVAAVGIVLTERRELTRDTERQLDKLAARLDETARQVAAVDIRDVGR